MKARNEKLHQEVLQVVEFKLHVPRLKDIAELIQLRGALNGRINRLEKKEADRGEHA